MLIEIADAIDPRPPPPPPVPQISLKPFLGGRTFEDEMVKYYGDTAGIGPIVTRTIEVVDRFAEAILKGDFEKAYSLISPMVKNAPGVQTRPPRKKKLTLQQFIADHKRADEVFGGAITGFSLRYFTWILADEAARLKASQAPKWPKGVDPTARRSVVVGFWERDGKEEGSWAEYTITEDNDQYYIAGYEFDSTSF